MYDSLDQMAFLLLFLVPLIGELSQHVASLDEVGRDTDGFSFGSSNHLADSI